MNRKENLPWTDKYRPKNISGIVHQDEVTRILADTIKTGQLPHLIFYGPPGTGKTSSILALAYQLFGPNIINNRVIELNASDERGINIVREKINGFASLAVSNPDPNYPSPPYKIIILDEADAMTTEAQSALRIVMEKSSRTTRFCFICNYINQIIDPIASRCMKLRFKPLVKDTLNDRLKEIAEQENFELKNIDEITDTISSISKGDARKAIMTLQNLKYIYKFKNKITVDDIYDITYYVSKNKIKILWDMLIKNVSFDKINNEINKFRKNSYSVTNILEHLQEFTVIENINDKKKSMICLQLGNTEKRLLEGADEYIQFTNICYYIIGVVHDKIDFIVKNIY